MEHICSIIIGTAALSAFIGFFVGFFVGSGDGPLPWPNVTAYRLLADPVRDALVEACQAARDWFRGGNQTVHDLCNQLDAALAISKGEKS